MSYSLAASLERFQGPAGSTPHGLREAARYFGKNQLISMSLLADRIQSFTAIRVLDPPLRIATQNLGLFPTAAIEFPLPDEIAAPTGVDAIGVVPLYKGKDRHLALQTLEAWLRSETPDVVVLTEFWVKEEKNSFTARVRDLYPHHVSGPNEDAPRAIELEVFDGGQLILSRFPIIDWHQTVFRQCEGEDCFVNKGALHIRIAHPQLPGGCDIFGSHMQSCPPEFGSGWISAGPGDCSEKLHVHQPLHLRDFVHAYSDPIRPAFLLGDLNHDGNDASEYDGLLAYLEAPVDIWQAAGEGAGITSDSNGTFQNDRDPRPLDDSKRLKDGKRLDYVLAWPTKQIPNPIEVLPTNAELVQLQTTPGRDLSDHYGILATISAVGDTAAESSETIQSVNLYARGLRCLRETGGPIPMVSEIAGSDEMIATLSFIRAIDGKKTTVEKQIDGLSTGDWAFFSDQLCVESWPDPGDHIDVSAQLIEDDPTPIGVSTGTVDMGTHHIRLTRSELLLHRGKGQLPRTLPLFRGDGGEYALTVAIEVT